MEGAITSQPESEIEKFRHNIQDWLLQEEWTLSDESDPQAFWVIKAEQPTVKIGLTILHPVQRMDRVEIIGAMTLSDEHKKKFMTLDGQKRRDFIQDLILMLLNTELGFGFENNPLQTVVISHRIYFDALTKDEFLLRVSSVLKGMALVRHFVQRKFNELDFRLNRLNELYQTHKHDKIVDMNSGFWQSQNARSGLPSFSPIFN